MNIEKHKHNIPDNIYEYLEKKGFKELRPCQIKAIDAGLFRDNNLLVCTPTASGKTLVAELAALHSVLNKKGKVVYLVPLRALAAEKFRDFKRDYPDMRIAMTSGDIDSDDSYLERYDIIIATSEKFDSLLRHKPSWIYKIKLLIVDEVHLLNDVSRGPTLEIIITLSREILPDLQIIGLSATIGNPKEIADWLSANLVVDSWRPVELREGVYLNGVIDFKKKSK